MKQRVDNVTLLTSQKVRQGLPQLYQEAGMWQWGELGTEACEELRKREIRREQRSSQEQSSLHTSPVP